LVIRKLAEADKLLAQGKTVEEVARHLEISEQTFHRWRNQYGGMKADDAKRLKELEKENQRLKKIVADQALDIDMLKELAEGTSDPGPSPASCRQAHGPARGLRERRAAWSARPAHPTPSCTSPGDEELALRAFLRDFSLRRPRWGWRRAARAARDAGWRVNDKWIHRLWRAEGLRVAYKKRKRPLRGIGVLIGAFCPLRPNVIWALDLQFERPPMGGNSTCSTSSTSTAANAWPSTSNGPSTLTAW
jgi:putative transposase